jgi:acetate kinase
MICTMHILALNCGSSSIKTALIDTHNRTHLWDARVEDIGLPTSRVRMDNEQPQLRVADHGAALQILLDGLRRRGATLPRIEAVAHRVVHGGAQFVQPVQVDDQTLAAIESLGALAPLHNPPALDAIRAARRYFAELPHVAVFDTAFHSTMPARSRQYALPRELCERAGIRRYGFHGINHAHVMRSVADYLRTQPQQLRLISCHLGSGASVAAIEYGRSVDTSMGMTPLEGLVMGTRCGDLDPGVLLHLLRSGSCDVTGLQELLNSASGLRGLTGTADLREIERRAGVGDEAARLAITLYSHRARKYIGAYAAVMGGVDVISFTGGIGENSALMRHRIAQRLEFLGARLDEDRNRDGIPADRQVVDIAEESSRVRILVICADEELSMANEAAQLLERSQAPSARIPVAVSARHAHLSQATLDRLFGHGYRLQERTALSQPGQFSAQETVSLIGPRGRLDGVRLMGPPREQDQIEISRTDEFTLGIDAPVRISGDLSNTPGMTLEGPAGRTTIASGVICARRHIHMSPADAQRFGLHDHDAVQVKLDTAGRDVTFADVVVRVSPQFQTELHLDTDEANAAGITAGQTAELICGPRLRAAEILRNRVS